ncbi:MFS transporter [Sphingobium sp. HBC34]|uniref:MFS transporter n=1 Tax=Sphingobium cyanobacteriorum TaxID=3063954 RepID=A0ABT8ZMU0_9SPHN|nr:MFS transporter [Sphingobium sp. HBC34]MDO7835521.1 MFS transporter [Sphingobium sp. HBC34]
METSSPVDALSHFATHAPRLRTGGLVSAIIIGIIGAMIIFVTPGFLAVVAAQAGLDDAHLGYIAACDINAMAVTIAISAFMLTRCDWRVAVGVALALVTVGNFGTAMASGFTGIALSRVVAGAGEGIAVGFAFAALGRAKNPDRAFAIYLVSGALFSSLILYTIPYLLVHMTPSGIFIGNGLLAVGAGLSLFHFPDGSCEDDMFAAGGRIDRRLAFLALATVFLYFFATGAMWSYVERIGMASGLSPSVIANGLSLGTLAGVAGAGLAGLVPQRWGRALPLIASGVISVASFQMLLGHVPAASFVIAAVLLLFGWNFAQPLLSGICAEADRCGRVVCAMGSIQTFGTGLGPAAAGATLRGGDFSVAIWASCAILVVSLGIVVFAIRGAGRHALPG